jgi:hypothetical protein
MFTLIPPLKTGCVPVLGAFVAVVVVVVVDVVLVREVEAAGAVFVAAGWVLGTPGTCAPAVEALKSKPDRAIAKENVRFIINSEVL